jgi:tRNA-Thr(GGU) m(6)t(6)A37 methyltransferase TsaA
MEEINQNLIDLKPIGYVRRSSLHENERDRKLISKIVFAEELAPALDGIDEWSHIYVIFWMDRVVTNGELWLHHPGSGVGIFSTRAPIHPNPIGLTLVELVDHKGHIIWVRGLDALDRTPVLDIKPYPDWEHGHLQVVVDFKIPEWLEKIIEQHP